MIVFRKSFCLGLVLALGCRTEPCPKGSRRKADGICHLVDAGGNRDSGETSDTDTDTDADTDADTDTVDTSDPGRDYGPYVVVGDPIEVVGFEGDTPAAPSDLLEWTDAAILSEGLGVVCGIPGVAVVDLSQGTTVATYPTQPCIRVAAHDGLIVATGRETDLSVIDASNPEAMTQAGRVRFAYGVRPREDVAVHSGRFLVGHHGHGARLFDGEGTLLSTLPAGDAFAVGLHETRAVITDGTSLVLWDISDPSSPVELYRATLPAEGRDLAFDGQRIAVAHGGAGIGLWNVSGDALVEVDRLVVPGSGLSVALDGDDIWVGSWQHTILLQVLDGQLESVAHEQPRFSSMGVAASGGRALVADWHGHQTLSRVEGVESPELTAVEKLYFGSDDSSQSFTLRNDGTSLLQWSAGAVPSGYAVTPKMAVVEPGRARRIRVDGPAAGASETAPLPWTSNDVDELSGSIVLGPPDRGVGAAHGDLTLPGFVWPSSGVQEFSLADMRGKVVILAYFALY